jgi:hypothetical protein
LLPERTLLHQFTSLQRVGVSVFLIQLAESSTLRTLLASLVGVVGFCKNGASS